MVDDLPLPKSGVEVTAVSKKPEKEKKLSDILQYDTTAYERGMHRHKPFYLYGIADEKATGTD